MHRVMIQKLVTSSQLLHVPSITYVELCGTSAKGLQPHDKLPRKFAIRSLLYTPSFNAGIASWMASKIIDETLMLHRRQAA